jgi:hypothetical protein
MASFPPSEQLRPIRILAVNSAAGSKGSIHDDEKAREMGYAGGFVPGSTVLGYMSRWMHETFGPRWYEGATFNGRLRRPVYEGVEVTIEGSICPEPSADEDRVWLDLRVLIPDGTVAAAGRASCAGGEA